LGTAEALYYIRPSRAVKKQFDEYLVGGMNVSEAVRAHQDYLQLSEGISEKTKTLLALLSTPNRELLHFGLIRGAKSVYDLEKENLPVR
jgi:hypothetical protein